MLKDATERGSTMERLVTNNATELTCCSCNRGEYINEKIIENDIDGNYIEILIDHTNERLKVLDYTVHDWEKVLSYLEEAASMNRSGKIIFYVRHSADFALSNLGYILEGVIPAFFRGEDALCYSRFINPERSCSLNNKQEEELLKKIQEEKNTDGIKELTDGYTARKIRNEHVDELVELYRNTFSSYPSPLLDTEYVHNVMQTHVTFYGVFAGDILVSAASAEVDQRNRNSEITDCATLPEHRGKGLLNNLIKLLEREMRGQKIGALYSLARAGSYGMNAALYRLGYEYKGRFINNCHIGGRYEDMNLWVKNIVLITP